MDQNKERSQQDTQEHREEERLLREKRVKRARGQAIKRRVFDIIEVGYDEDALGRGYDILNLTAIVVNLLVSVGMTFDGLMAEWGSVFVALEWITVIFFTVDYFLRLWTAPLLYPGIGRGRAVLKYFFSFNGLVDMLSCIPFYLPFLFPTGGMAAFRIFRVMRIFRIFRINAYFDSLNLIFSVISNKANLLFSSVFVILMLMLAASIGIYSLEHTAQPEVFDNAFSGMWWAAITLFTVGYGDIYPITFGGRVLGMLVTILGVGLVAIPTGIISAGFVEQYEKLRTLNDREPEKSVPFVRLKLEKGDTWIGKSIRDIVLPGELFVAAVGREGSVHTSREDWKLKEGDTVLLGAKGYKGDQGMQLTDMELKAHHPWIGQCIRDLDISRRTYIVAILREGQSVTPRGSLELMENDRLLVLNKKR